MLMPIARRIRARLLHWLLALALSAAVLARPCVAQSVVFVATGAGSAQQWPVWIADAKGFFAAAGLKMDFVAAPSASAGTQQVTAGSAHIGAGGLVDPIRAIDRGAQITLLRIETQAPAYSILAKPAYTTMQELKGRVVMIGGIKDITRIFFERTAIPNGLKPGEYDMVFAGTAASRLAALVAGAIDATILLPPFTFKATAAGFRTLADVPDFVKDLPFSGIMVNLAWARQNKPAIAAFLQAMSQGVDWFNNESNRNEAVEILMKLNKSERSEVDQTYGVYHRLKVFDRRGLIEASQIGNLLKALKDFGELEGAADVARFVNPELAGMASAVK